MNMVPIPTTMRTRNLKPAADHGLKGLEPATQPMILVVDDDRIMRVTLKEALGHRGYSLKLVQDGEEAVGILNSHAEHIDAVILDRVMPGIDGLEVVRRMKSDPRFSSIPIVMLTGDSDQAKIQEGIEAGVFYYLIKPTNHTLLCKVIDAALRERQQKQALLAELDLHTVAIKNMTSCRLAVRTLTEAEDTSCFLASCFPDANRVVQGLMELLANAVEHGNLAIPYEIKQRFLNEGTWHEEVNRRALLPENAGKFVDVIYQSKDEGHLVQITDQGNGFEWSRFWHINPSRATAAHGRGIARARMTSFDRMSYNEKGNSVTVMVNKTAAPQGYAW